MNPFIHVTLSLSPDRKFRLSFSAILPIIFLLSAGLSAQTPSWSPFTSPTDGFRALFPSQPAVSKSTVPVGGDKFELRSYDAQVASTEFYIGICDYGVKGRAASADELLKSAEKGAVDHMNAHVQSEKNVALGSNAGIAFEAENGQLHFSVRMYKSGGVLYQVMVAMPRATTTLPDESASTARFLDSFEFLAPSAAPTTAAAPATTAAPAPAQADRKLYKSSSDGFSASFPSEPNVQKQNISTDLGQFELRTYVAEDSSAALIVAVCDYGAAATGKNPELLIESAKNGAVNNLKAHIVSERSVTLDSHLGVAFEAENDTDHIAARIFMVGTFLYQAIVIGPIKDHYADTAQFLDSFHMLDKTAP